MSKKRKVLFFSLVIIFGLFLIFDTGQVQAASKTVKYKGKTIAKYTNPVRWYWFRPKIPIQIIKI